MSVYYLITKKYLFSKKKQSISTMIKICFFSLVVAALSLALSIFIMSGFEKETNKKLKGINSEIILQSLSHAINFEKVEKVLKEEFKEIESFSPISNQYALLDKNSEIDLNQVLLVRGINPQKEEKTTKLSSFIKNKQNNIEIISNNKIIIGKKLAKNENLKIGDRIKLIFAQPTKKRNKIDFKDIEVEINGFINTGLEDLDSTLVICSNNFLQENLQDYKITQINIKPKNNSNIDKLIKKLNNKFMMYALSWKDLFPSIASTLKLEKYVTFIILSLLILLASMNLVSLIFMLITQKRKDIAIFYTLGMPINKIRKIFILINLAITSFSSGIGVLLAIILGFGIKYKEIKIPDAYYITTLPVDINIKIAFIIFIFSILIALTTSYIPIKNIKKNQIINYLKS